MSAARGKRKTITTKFIQTLSRENRSMPSFSIPLPATPVQQQVILQDDPYSDRLLIEYGPLEATVGHAAKFVTGNGNCLFNSASVALIGKKIYVERVIFVMFKHKE